jgi:hypothetical protein
MRRKISSSDGTFSTIARPRFGRDLRARRSVRLELPEFLVCALEARVAEVNDGARPEERCTLDHYIESELLNLVTLRDVAEMESRLPGFAEAVQQWVLELGT